MSDVGKLEIRREDYRRKWVLRFNLHELFYGKEENYVDPDIIHYTRWCRIKRVIKLLNQYSYENEEAVKDFKEWLESELIFYKDKKDKKKITLLERALKEVQDGKQ